MRITNQMISNNSLRNMQKTMANVDNRTTQMETGKKITKASEDPVVAVRALKLRKPILPPYKNGAAKPQPAAPFWGTAENKLILSA